MAKRSLPKDFPLFKHASGRWCKKGRGKHRYFGKVSADTTGEKALALWLEQRDDLLAGREPRPVTGVDLRTLVNAFLTAKERAVDAGELQARMFAEYYAICDRMLRRFGSGRAITDILPEDFAVFRSELAKRYAPTALAKRIKMARTQFKFGYDAGILDRPVRYGPEFHKPSAKTLRLARARRKGLLLSAEEIRGLIDAAGVQLRAMIYLGVNLGMGNTDVSELPLIALDLDAGLIDYARPKTGCHRKAVLWSETVTALKAAIADRPEPRDPEDKHRVFLTRFGNPWLTYYLREGKRGVAVDSIGLEFGKLLAKVGIDRPRTGFYTLRHVYRSVVDDLPDRPAIDLTMGHEPPNDMRTHYVPSISVDRLRVVADHVHNWLSPVEKTAN